MLHFQHNYVKWTDCETSTMTTISWPKFLNIVRTLNYVAFIDGTVMSARHCLYSNRVGIQTEDLKEAVNDSHSVKESDHRVKS